MSLLYVIGVPVAIFALLVGFIIYLRLLTIAQENEDAAYIELLEGRLADQYSTETLAGNEEIDKTGDAGVRGGWEEFLRELESRYS